MNKSVIVIGAGQAAAQLAMSLRQGAFTDRIVLIGEEPYAPYQRPPLSKKFLAERPKPDSLFLRPEAFWRDQNVELQLGTRVGAIDVPNRRVALIDGHEIGYGTIVLATGTRARHLPIPGTELSGVMSLRSIGDVHRLRPALDAAARIIIVGGGYIGLEVAAIVRAEGREVIVLEAEDRVLKRVTAPVVSEFFDTLHRGRGVDIRLNARLAAIAGEKKVSGVRLTDGSTLATDLVLLATGAEANEELARTAGLACNNGIVVDELARTSAPDAYAIGDCTRFPSRRYGRAVRLESVQNAIDQAKAAASAMLGAPRPYDPVPWFWSDQYEIKLQIAGLLDGYDSAEPVGDLPASRFSVEYRCGGRLVAVDAVNDARAHMTARRRIAAETETAHPASGTS
jgi:3-phenylpropionate/trans-cinnamate dioxygenase ferredoxin reductase subunit